MEETPDENDPNYVNFYQKHLRQFKDHIAGIDHDIGPLYPSYFPPCGYWTAEDKNLFFHALSVHSKLRPDLIAGEIPNKTVVDVMIYLDMLENGANDQPKKRVRAHIEAAMEVSDKWIDFEEKASSVIIEKEVEWEKDHREEQRRSVLKAREHDQRAALAKEERGRHRRRQVAREVADVLSEQWTKADYIESLSGPHLQAMDCILREAEEPSEKRFVPGQEGGTREDEAALPDAQEMNVVPDSVIDPALLALSRSPAPPSGSLPHESRSRENLSTGDGPPTTPSVDVPPLPDVTEPRALASNQENAAPPAPPQDELGLTAEALAALSPQSRRRHQKRLYMRRKRAQVTGGVVSSSIVRLKPGRKTNKRLERQIAKGKEREEKTRRMELELAGLDAVSAGDAGMDVDLGGAEYVISAEEAKEDYMDVTAGKEEFEVTLQKSDEETREGEGEEPQDQRHRNVGGTTLPYKILQDLEDLGYTADTLERDGLGLFHLTNMHKLMGIYASLQSVSEFVGTCISASTIQLLHAHVLHFIYDLIRQSISLRERERKSKAHTKIWRMRQHLITTPTVHKALELMGVRQDKKAHFASLVDRVTCLSETLAQTAKRRKKEEKLRAKEKAEEERNASIDVNEEDDDVESEETNSDEGNLGNDSTSDDDDDDEGASRRPLPALPIHRTLNPPFIYHRALDYTHPNPRAKQSSEWEWALSDIDITTEEGGDGLLPAEMDAEALLQEMLEEEEVDERDREVDKRVEGELWERMRRDGWASDHNQEQIQDKGQEGGKKREGGGEEEEEEGRERKRRKPRNSLRFAEPDGAHFVGIKSAVYVEDSD